MVSSLSTKTKGLASGLLSDPNKMENVIGLVRTAAPLTSDKTISKINTYLPAFERASTLLGMYSFLNRAQNFAPIQSLNAKTPVEKISSLITNGNIPIGKMLAQPIIANNMDKIMSSVAKGVLNNGNLNLNDMMSLMSNQLSNNRSSDSTSDDNSSNNMDLTGLMETFMPLMNNIMSNKPTTSEDSHTQEKDNTDNESSHNEEDFKNTTNDDPPKKTVQKNTPIHIRQRKRKAT